MPSKHLFRVHPEKYRQLLGVLIFMFLVSPFLNHGLGEVASGLLLLYTLVAILKTIELPRTFLYGYMVIAVSAFSLQVLAAMDVFPLFHQSLSIVIQGIFAIYLGGAAYWIAQDIFEHPEASLDTMRGGVSVYLLLGFVWALLYGMVAIADPNAFSPPIDPDASFLRAMHFSFTTLTTLGYGDIIPKGDLALILTNLEAIAGQMYSTIFIAILVGGYLARRPS